MEELHALCGVLMAGMAEGVTPQHWQSLATVTAQSF